LHISKEEKIEILNKRIENFKNSIKDPNTFDYAIYASNSPKKDRIRAWAEALEHLHDLGEYKDDICTISKHISTELKSMGLPKATEWARHCLPYKYKDSTKIHAEKLLEYEYRGFQDHKKTEQEITKYNQPYIDRMDRTIKLCQDFKTKLRTTEFLTLIPDIEFNEFETRSKGLERLIRDGMDHRDKVLPEKLHLLLYGYTEGTKNDMFNKYMKYARNIIDITAKQAVRLVSGRCSKVELLYEPKNRAEARQAGFYGVTCDECGSWRIDHKYNTDSNNNMLFCYACRTWQEIKTKELMTKVI